MGWRISPTPRPPLSPARPGTHCTWGWVGPRAGLDRCGKSRPHRDSIQDHPARSSVAIPTELPGPQLLQFKGKPCAEYTPIFANKSMRPRYCMTHSLLVTSILRQNAYRSSGIRTACHQYREAQTEVGWQCGRLPPSSPSVCWRMCGWQSYSLALLAITSNL